jgi:uncharacterized protein YpmB
LNSIDSKQFSFTPKTPKMSHRHGHGYGYTTDKNQQQSSNSKTNKAIKTETVDAESFLNKIAEQVKITIGGASEAVVHGIDRSNKTIIVKGVSSLSAFDGSAPKVSLPDGISTTSFRATAHKDHTKLSILLGGPSSRTRR